MICESTYSTSTSGIHGPDQIDDLADGRVFGQDVVDPVVERDRAG